MSFEHGYTGKALTRRQRRLTRALWWFEHMRRVVDRATAWEPVAQARPEQIWFPGSHRQVALASESERDAA